MNNLLDRLEKRMGRHYIPQLMKYICLAMLGVLVLEYLPLPQSAWNLLRFNKQLILQGQVWRLITFIFLPPMNGNLIFTVISLYFYYFLGTSLENHWGSARFNLYYAIGVVGAVIAGFITGFTTNEYLNLSLMLAFAILYPDMEIMLFFFLPVKMRWIGGAWGLYLLYQLVVMPWMYKCAVILALLPLIVFFGKQAWLQLRMDARRIMYKIRNR